MLLFFFGIKGHTRTVALSLVYLFSTGSPTFPLLGECYPEFSDPEITK